MCVQIFIVTINYNVDVVIPVINIHKICITVRKLIPYMPYICKTSEIKIISSFGIQLKDVQVLPARVYSGRSLTSIYIGKSFTHFKQPKTT